jgi:hypothetical protein
MRRETFFVGLARKGEEIDVAGYKRQILLLEYDTASGMYSNAASVDFDPALHSYGFVDGLVLSTSLDGEVKAVCPLFVPMNIATGAAAVFAPGTINMNLKSFQTIRGIRPIEVS